ncbi:hypothetical protein BH11BAC6_BH11BAC6_11840 [soil metagenome]
MKSKKTMGILFFAAAAIAVTSLLYLKRKRTKNKDDYDWLMW